MEKIFITILNMSLTASYAIIFVLIARLFLKKSPKIYSYLLWSVVLFRLLCPFSFESAVSIFPKGSEAIQSDILYSQTPEISTGIESVDKAINPMLPVPKDGDSVNPLQVWSFLSSHVWYAGMVILAIYSLISLLKLKKTLKNGQKLSDNIYISENIGTAFVLGIARPKIYLPKSIECEQLEHILLHEQTHIDRKDYIWKIVAFVTACLHWFNPLVWVAFSLWTKDMEMSCDETVIRKLGENVKKSYSGSLLSLSVMGKVACVPLAFGEGSTKGRIKNVLGYKKPAKWVAALALVGVTTALICLGTNPISYATPLGNEYAVSKIVYSALEYSFAYTTETAPGYAITDDFDLYKREKHNNQWEKVADLQEYEASYDKLRGMFNPVAVDTVRDAEKILKNAKTIYHGQALDMNDVFYLVIQLKDGSTALAYGYNNIRNYGDYVRWFFELTPVKSEFFTGVRDTKAVNIRDVWENRTQYVGNASKVGGIVGGLTFADGVAHSKIQLFTKEPPYGIEVSFEDEKAIAYYENEENRVELMKNAMMMFCVIENVEQITFKLVDEESTQMFSYTKSEVQDVIGADCFEKSESYQGFLKQAEQIEEHFAK